MKLWITHRIVRWALQHIVTLHYAHIYTYNELQSYGIEDMYESQGALYISVPLLERRQQ